MILPIQAAKRGAGLKTRRGFILLLMAVMAMVLFGAVGLAVDLGRMFIVRHEAQVYTDTAALAAALKLNGKQAGATAAETVVDNWPNKWDMGTRAFTGVTASHTVEFANSANGPWLTAAAVPLVATGYQYVRVRATTQVPLTFLQAVVPKSNTQVGAQAVAGQIPQTTFYEGAFPFSPMSFSPTDPTTGFTPGVQYTIRYPATKNKPVCDGDEGIHERDDSERGYWGDNSASVIAKRILNDYQSGAVATAGQPIDLVGGAKTTEATYVNARSAQDSDTTSTTIADYFSSANGVPNGRRLVVMPISNYDTSVALGFATFLLLPPGSYGHTGNSFWCAIYVGPGTMNQPEGGAASTPGAYTVRLIQ
jgi:Flp pilus assembly protein TadG